MPEVLVAGRPVHVPEGASVLAALTLAGHRALRSSVSGEPRGALCGIGMCFECRAVIDGRVERTCVTPARDGQRVTLLGSDGGPA